jgi:hypothetical protein
MCQEQQPQERKMGKRIDISVTGKDLLALVESQGHKCALTGWDLTPEVATLDHKTPLCRGGLHAIENVWIVHKDANRSKSTFTAEEFLAICKAVYLNSIAQSQDQAADQHDTLFPNN